MSDVKYYHLKKTGEQNYKYKDRMQYANARDLSNARNRPDVLDGTFEVVDETVAGNELPAGAVKFTPMTLVQTLAKALDSEINQLSQSNPALVTPALVLKIAEWDGAINRLAERPAFANNISLIAGVIRTFKQGQVGEVQAAIERVATTAENY